MRYYGESDSARKVPSRGSSLVNHRKGDLQKNITCMNDDKLWFQSDDISAKKVLSHGPSLLNKG